MSIAPAIPRCCIASGGELCNAPASAGTQPRTQPFHDLCKVSVAGRRVTRPPPILHLHLTRVLGGAARQCPALRTPSMR